MKTIVHTCSSVLVRPNGIVRYMNAVMDLQRSLGHRVVFVTDAKPTQQINADEILYEHDVSQYVPNMRDGHVWLQVDQQLSHTIHQLLITQCPHVDLVISHDIHSYLGAVKIYNDGIFVQHESDVLNPERYSFLDDNYLDQQIKIVNDSPWRIGMVVPSTNVAPKRFVYAPMPFALDNVTATEKTKGLMYIGDSTERKGARDFMRVARELGITPTVITHDRDSEVFAGADVYSFALSERASMIELIQQHRVCYYSSRNECGPIAVLECLQFMPVIVNADRVWTRNISDWGVVAVPDAEVVSTIKSILETPREYANPIYKSWVENSHRIWHNLSV